MLHFSAHHPLYALAGAALAFAQLFLFVFGLPPFQAGAWFQTEPALLALLILGALNALWLCAGLHRKWLCPVRAHPLWLALLAWGAWQIVVTLLSATSWRSWFGSPSNGMGAAGYIVMLLCCMVMYALCAHARYRAWLLAAAASSLAIQAVMHLAIPSGAWKPNWWPDYMAFMAVYLWIAACLWYRLRDTQFLLLLLFTLFVLYASENLVAMMFLPLALLVALIARVMRDNTFRRLLYPGAGWRVCMLAGFAVPALWCAFALYASADISRLEDAPVAGELMDPESSMGMRTRLLRLSMHALAQEPRRLLMGDGWADNTDSSFRHALIDGVSAFNGEAYNPNWTLLYTYSFHSHNQPLEALVSFGAAGLALWYLVFYRMLAAVPRRRFWLCAPVIAALCALTGFWFELPLNLPYQALAFAALCGGGKNALASPAPAWQRASLCAALALAAITLAWSAHQQYRAIRYSDGIYAMALAADATPRIPSAKQLAEDIKRDGERLYHAISILTDQMYQRQTSGTLNPDDPELYLQFLYAAHQAGQSGNLPSAMRSAELFMLNHLFVILSDPAFSGIKQEAKLYLPGAVALLAKIAPDREDMAGAFLANLDAFSNGNELLEIDFLRRLLAIHPRHRSALWLLGRKLARDPHARETGIAMQRDALALGVQRVFPIEASEVEEVVGNAGIEPATR